MSGLAPEELRAIARVMEQSGVHLSADLEADQIAGGRSNLTFRLRSGSSSWVLRMPPRAGRTPSAHDVAREFRVTAALAGTNVPVPTPLVLCQDEGVLEVPFTVAEFVEGHSVQSRVDLEVLDDAALSAVVESMIATLVALHQVDPVRVGLEAFGRPTGYSARQLKRWCGQWEIVGSPPLQSLAVGLASTLNERVPEQGSISIVHGDFRIDNILVDLTSSRVAALLDWELSTLGNPLADVAMMCAYRHPAFDSIVGAPSAWTSPRLPDVEGLRDAYQEAAGGGPIKDWDFHLSLAYFKVAVIAAGIDHRFRAGVGEGPGFNTAGEAVEPLLRAGLATMGAKK